MFPTKENREDAGRSLTVTELQQLERDRIQELKEDGKKVGNFQLNNS